MYKIKTLKAVFSTLEVSINTYRAEKVTLEVCDFNQYEILTGTPYRVRIVKTVRLIGRPLTHLLLSAYFLKKKEK